MHLAKRPDTATGSDRRQRLTDLFGAVRRWRERWTWLVAAYRAHRREPELFDAARTGRTSQSSRLRRKRTAGSPLGDKAGFRATRTEDHPWWMVEFEHDWPIHAIRIHNRSDNSALHAANLVVSVSPDKKEWQVVHSGLHYFGDEAAPGPLEVRLLGRYGGRYVRLELPHRGMLCLRHVEVLVERKHRALLRTCRRYGFRFPLMTALRMNHPQMKSYVVETPPRRFDGTIQALYLGHRVGRFGNHVKQLIHAVIVARRLGLRTIYVMPFRELPVVEPIEADGIVLLPASRLRADRPGAVLRGSFFYPQPFAAALRAIRGSETAWAVDNFVSPLFRRKAQAPLLLPRDSDLAIHIRSGDIFSERKPHSHYVQPPLAFYQLCIMTARRTLGVDRVILVYENELNPCIAALKRWLAETGCPFVAQSASVQEDLAVLMHARHCVFGVGSFGRAVALLSDRMATLFYPWLEPAYKNVLNARPLRAMVVSDASDGYMKRGNWRRSPEQIKMMMEYPIENLVLADGAPAAQSTGPSDLRAVLPAP